ncbi:MAG: PAS domain S-box protein [Acidimicrobiales bacterium]
MASDVGKPAWTVRRVAAVLALLTYVPLGVLAYLSITLSTRALGRVADARVETAAALEARAVLARANGVRSLAASLAARPSIVGAVVGRASGARDVAALQAALDGAVLADQEITWVGYTDPNGILLAISPAAPDAVGRDFNVHAWYGEALRTGGVYVSNAEETSTTDRPLEVAVATPIRGNDGGAVIGYLSLGYSLTALQDFVSAFALAEQISLSITDQQGTVIASPNLPIGLVSASDREPVRLARVETTGVLSQGSPDGRQIVGYAAVGNLGWTVTAVVPASVVHERIDPLRVAVAAIALVLTAGLTAALVLTARTLRARTLAEERLRSASRYARSLIEASLDPLVTISPEGKITDVNEAAVRITGVERVRLVGTAFSTHCTEPERADEGYRRVFAEGRLTDYPLTIQNTNGEMTDVLYNAALYRSAGGDVEGVVAAARDVTERNRTERALHESQERYRGLVESQHELIIRVDPEGRYTFLNDAYCARYGVNREEIDGSTTFLRFVHPDDLAVANEAIKSLARPPYREYVELRTTGVHGERWVGTELYSIRDESGAILEIQAVGRDIDDRKQAEAEVTRRTHELELVNIDLDRSNAELEQFAYVASHDLSEPLRAIAGPIALVAKRYQGRLDAEADQFIGFAVDGCTRMQLLIDGLLAYSRVGRLEVAIGPVDCNLLMKEVLAALGPAIAEAGALVQVGQLPIVTGEPTQLAQVFQNLVANALKFVPLGTTPLVVVAAERGGSMWRFTITDNGIGIAPEHRDRIFGMFKRLNSREKYAGTGIGLALAKKIVERHGGQIGIDDAPGTGSCFWFTLRSREENGK